MVCFGTFLGSLKLDTPCKAGARSLNFFEVQVVGQYIANGMEHNRLIWPHNVICHNTIIVDPIQQNPDLAEGCATSLSWPACRSSLLIHEPRTSHDVLLEPRASYSVFAGVRPDLSENVFFKFWKKSSKRVPKEGSKRVPERAAVKS